MTVQLPVTARALISGNRFISCRTTVMDATSGMSEEGAGRIVEEDLEFVAACAPNPTTGLVPSQIVEGDGTPSSCTSPCVPNCASAPAASCTTPQGATR